jgi:hypothetical protein
MPQIARIEIQYDLETGALQLNAPVQMLGLCYSMLDLAKDVCREQNKKLQEQRVQIAEGINVPSLPPDAFKR